MFIYYMYYMYPSWSCMPPSALAGGNRRALPSGLVSKCLYE